MGVQEDDPVCADAEPAVADGGKPGVFLARQQPLTVVDQDEVVARAMVLVKGDLHFAKTTDLSACRKIFTKRRQSLGNDADYSVI
jgi:hypothetical protein